MPFSHEAAVAIGNKPRIRKKLRMPKKATTTLNELLIQRDMDSRLLYGAPFVTEAKSLQDVGVRIAMNFVPLRADGATPWTDAVKGLFKKVIMMLYTLLNDFADNFIRNIIRLERCPFVLKYDADSGTNKFKYEHSFIFPPHVVGLLTISCEHSLSSPPPKAHRVANFVAISRSPTTSNPSTSPTTRKPTASPSPPTKKVRVIGGLRNTTTSRES